MKRIVGLLSAVLLAVSSLLPLSVIRVNAEQYGWVDADTDFFAVGLATNGRLEFAVKPRFARNEHPGFQNGIEGARAGVALVDLLPDEVAHSVRPPVVQ